MKKNSKLLIAVALFVSLAIGFLIGISVEYPRLNNNEVSGTIGKVNNYRNTKATEADIELKNELLADTAMLKSVKNYMNFFYVRSLEFGKNIDFAVTVANANDAFKATSGNEIVSLESYGKFLGSARKDLLLAVIACKSVDKTDPILLRSSIAQANNIIAQMNYRNSAVINFITELDSFIQEKGINNAPELNKAHDLLTYNEINSSILLKDKVTLKFFEQKKLYSKDLKSAGTTNFQECLQKDVEQLGKRDTEELGFLDVEQLGWLDEEQLSQALLFDTEELGGAIGAFDAERLGAGFTDAENLGSMTVFDAEKLGSVGFIDSEQLGIHLDAEILGVH